ncbi:MAG TPA: ion transporter [Pseudonocardiaceae bacterium]
MSMPEAELNSGILPGNVHADDFVMLALALLSVGVLGEVVLSPPAPSVGIWLFYADVAISAIFIVEFFLRWRKRGWGKAFPMRNWYEVFAMIPIAHPALYHLHVVTVVLLLVRVGRAADRAIGEQFFYRLVDRLVEPLVQAIKKPVTVAVLDEVVKVLETGNYPENLARSLTDSREQLRAIISEKLSEDKQLSRLKLLPFHAEIVHSVVDTSFRVVLEVLRDPRIDDFFAAVVRDNREQIRKAVQLGLNDDYSAEKEKLLRVRTQRSAAREYDSQHPKNQ